MLDHWMGSGEGQAQFQALPQMSGATSGKELPSLSFSPSSVQRRGGAETISNSVSTMGHPQVCSLCSCTCFRVCEKDGQPKHGEGAGRLQEWAEG